LNSKTREGKSYIPGSHGRKSPNAGPNYIKDYEKIEKMDKDG